MRGHAASARRRGLTNTEIDAIADPLRWPATFTEAEVVLLDLGTRLCHDSHDLGPELIDRLRKHFDDRQLAEILLVAGQANMNNRAGSAARQLFARPTTAG